MTQEEARNGGMGDPRCRPYSSIFYVLYENNQYRYMLHDLHMRVWEYRDVIVERWIRTRAGWQSFFV